MSDYYIMRIEEMMGRIRFLEEENEQLKNKINEATKYIEKMSYQEIVSNPKKDLIKILKKENK